MTSATFTDPCDLKENNTERSSAATPLPLGATDPLFPLTGYSVYAREESQQVQRDRSEKPSASALAYLAAQKAIGKKNEDSGEVGASLNTVISEGVRARVSNK
jgi:hypothetical protein